jgi:hypothetical protein
MGEQNIDPELTREVFRRFLVEDGRAKPRPADVSPAARARLNLFGDAIRDAVAGARAGDEDGIEASFAQAQQVGSRLDVAEMLDSVHPPDGAGEHEGALRRLMQRIPGGWGRWISCGPGWFELLARAEAQLTVLCPTFEVHQIKEKFGTLRLYVEFDLDDDLPPELRHTEPRCPSRHELASVLGVTDSGRESPLGAAWSEAYEAIFEPAHEAWSTRAAAFRESPDGKLAAEEQSRRAVRFRALVQAFERESASTCDRCGDAGELSRTTARVPWYATCCDACRPEGWIRASD